MTNSNPPIQPTETDPTLHAVLSRFAESDCCWFCSVRQDGRAHSVPIWHVWAGGRGYVITEPKSIKVTNILGNPSVVMTHPDPMNPIILEGQGRLAPDRLHEIAPQFKAKYDWNPAEDAGYSAVIEITPTKLMAWGKYGEGRWGKEILAQETSDRFLSGYAPG